MATIAVKCVETVENYFKDLKLHIVTRMTVNPNMVMVSLFEFYRWGWDGDPAL